MQVFIEGLSSDGKPPKATASSSNAPSPGWTHLVRIASACSLVIVEEMPVQPQLGWHQALRAQLPEATTLWAVDTACVLPVQAVEKHYERLATFQCVLLEAFVRQLVNVCCVVAGMRGAARRAVHAGSVACATSRVDDF